MSNPVFFYAKFYAFVAIAYTSVLKYDKAYFQKKSRVYNTICNLITFQKSMLLYQERRKAGEI